MVKLSQKLMKMSYMLDALWNGEKYMSYIFDASEIEKKYKDYVLDAFRNWKRRKYLVYILDALWMEKSIQVTYLPLSKREKKYMVYIFNSFENREKILWGTEPRFVKVFFLLSSTRNSIWIWILEFFLTCICVWT